MWVDMMMSIMVGLGIVGYFTKLGCCAPTLTWVLGIGPFTFALGCLGGAGDPLTPQDAAWGDVLEKKLAKSRSSKVTLRGPQRSPKIADFISPYNAPPHQS